MADQVLTPSPAHPLPIEQFNNSGLRDSITAALAGVDPGHGHAILDVDNKGAGVMVVERINETWAVVLAGRYSFEDKAGAAQVAVRATW